jgi:hypothetical protein
LVLAGYSDEDKSENNDNDNYVSEELESWRVFSDCLRINDRNLFENMLKEASEYRKEMETKGSLYKTESLLMTIIFMQQKMIRKLIGNQKLP